MSLYEGIYRPALYRVGELWSEHQLSVASEHMVTAGLGSQVWGRVSLGSMLLRAGVGG